MKKITIYILSGWLLIAVGACTKPPEKETDRISQSESIPEQEIAPVYAARGRGKGLKQGLGQGRTGVIKGRGLGRRWQTGVMVNIPLRIKNTFEIKTVKAVYREIETILEAMGKIIAHPHRKAIVSYAFPARVAEIHVNIGQWVRKGQKLVTLQSEEVGEAKSSFYKAQADYELAKLNYQRQKRLVERGVGAQKDLLAAEAALKVAEATLNTAEKKLHLLGFTEEQVQDIIKTHQINPTITLFAPIRGKIITNQAVLGALVDQATEILSILDPTLLCVDASIYEKDIAKVSLGQEVKVKVPAYSDEIFTGKISYISDVLDEETRTITIRTEVENRREKLKPGMFANIQIILSREEKALVIPRAAILDDLDETIVFISENGSYFPRIVTTGTVDNGFIQILYGLKEGDEVVTEGNYQLKSLLYEDILKKGHVH